MNDVCVTETTFIKKRKVFQFKIQKIDHALRARLSELAQEKKQKKILKRTSKFNMTQSNQFDYIFF